MTGYDYLLSKLPHGRRMARHMKDVEEELGVDDRNLRLIINSARDMGYLIATSSAGIWIPENVAEVRESNVRRTHMALSIFRSERSSRRFLRAAEMNPSLTVADWIAGIENDLKGKGWRQVMLFDNKPGTGLAGEENVEETTAEA